MVVPVKGPDTVRGLLAGRICANRMSLLIRMPCSIIWSFKLTFCPKITPCDHLAENYHSRQDESCTVLSEWNWIKPILCTKRPNCTLLFYNIKVQTCSCLPEMFLRLMRPFKWGTAWSFILRGIKITSEN